MKTLLGLGECMVELSPADPGLWRQGFAGDVFNTLWYARHHLDDSRLGALWPSTPTPAPGLWPDLATMRETTIRAAAAATIVLPSLEDEAIVFGDASPWATASRYASLGCYHVVVKDGNRPTLLSFNAWTQAIPLHSLVEATDATAAGHSFDGAYLACFAQTGNAVAAVQAGHACAARVVAVQGVLVAL